MFPSSKVKWAIKAEKHMGEYYMHVLLREKSQCEKHNAWVQFVTFWKRQIYRASKKISGCQGPGGKGWVGEAQEIL